MTYSLGATGQRADYRPAVTNTLDVGDEAGLLGSQQNAARNGTPILCRGPDGSQDYYTIDAERSLPGALVMRKL